MSLLDGATTLVSSGFTVQLCFCLRAHADGRTDAFEVGALCCVCLSNKRATPPAADPSMMYRVVAIDVLQLETSRATARSCLLIGGQM